MKFYMVTLFILLYSCGNPTVEINESVYEPKIVFDAYLFNGEPVSDIFLKRNYPIGKKLDLESLFLNEAVVELTDKKTGVKEVLDFNPETGAFHDADGSFGTVQKNRTYLLSVAAVIDGKSVLATAETTTPENDIQLQVAYPDLVFDPNKKQMLSFNAINNAAFYLVAIRPKTIAFDNLIADHPYIQNDFNQKKFDENAQEMNVAFTDIFHLEHGTKTHEEEIEWFNLFFYGDYTMTIYAGDNNFKDFYYTYREVTEADGNLVEPKFHFKGDGIGVFGSASVHTITFKIKKD